MVVRKMRARGRTKCPQCPWTIKRNQWIYLYVIGQTKVWVHGPCYWKLVNGSEEPRFELEQPSIDVAALLPADIEAIPHELPAGVVTPEGFKGVLSK